MYRHRCRPKYSTEELSEIYASPHQHEQWPDHVERVKKTIEVGRVAVGPGSRVADLSCGDAAIALALQPEDSLRILGDFAPGYQYQGPIEDTIEFLDDVDLFICSETVEHLDDPDAVLRQIRAKSNKLLLSTPNCSWPDPNIEHYWSWDRAAVRLMLRKAGWRPLITANSYTGLGYNYQIWLCQ